MSSFLQIETLWRFNAKYEPEWLPRYVVYDTAEHLVPVVLAILRAESLSEVPVIGRMIAASDRRAHAGLEAAADSGSGASLLPGPDQVRTVPSRSGRSGGGRSGGGECGFGSGRPGNRIRVGPDRR